MKIGIDARLISETGIGRYIKNLLTQLSILDKTNDFIIYLSKREYEIFKIPNERWKKVCADVPWHSFSEQVIMPFLFLRDRLDILHVPYFNVPILYPGKFVVTIHDLIVLHADTGKASTLPAPLYFLRRLGYLVSLSVGLRRASHILVVSNETKKELHEHFIVPPDRITVTYEGVDAQITSSNNMNWPQKVSRQPYFLYVGNAYPHKNIDLLIGSFRELKKSTKKNIQLVLVGASDYFYKKLEQDVISEKDIYFYGYASDDELHALYSHALALVFPSKMEGFGLPALEALAHGCPVICSDIAVFREILEGHVCFFEESNILSLTQKMLEILSSQRDQFIPTQKTYEWLRIFSWKKLAQITLDVYLHA